MDEPLNHGILVHGQWCTEGIICRMASLPISTTLRPTIAGMASVHFFRDTLGVRQKTYSSTLHGSMVQKGVDEDQPSDEYVVL
ncbi:hypothetical protein Z517_03215 [Fonsecaea pedrosoi CBS 271.37]|uniref:Unplaced genomic scaffold supercont1.2, whole genome shotgun sequence n=1 Tax=Fonsecaea pedrosoi CBS 271.37 TaxID=1442368 RepID=A0A0D2HHR8_9EURO|nr:uncharacterized protein Z517_03215 [Fonsecaea pedrosoi CBS 271.37]KIW83969.1 hypothetical protein Z517_03215 [Fonsecaea pedrosoi CBS 271.37]